MGAYLCGSAFGKIRAAMIRKTNHEKEHKCGCGMSNIHFRTKMPLTVDAFAAPEEDVVPLQWSIPAWITLAAASWAGVYFVFSLIF